MFVFDYNHTSSTAHHFSTNPSPIPISQPMGQKKSPIPLYFLKTLASIFLTLQAAHFISEKTATQAISTKWFVNQSIHQFPIYILSIYLYNILPVSVSISIYLYSHLRVTVFFFLYVIVDFQEKKRRTKQARPWSRQVHSLL